ncbi:hypothetical protein BDV96DRAFT_285675 [Lophiotrema nucula]|uniref:Uncharacterized protein n=1 Tax=Lophiotrema nucula TaxID=690887 RepID=A0A6A5YMP1_9PLEO|nr:hypothetical protein BDV96DRAFT_285675 [Lophiotrema nucula]
MLPKLLSNIITFTKGLFAGQIVDNRLNPHLLTLAITGYNIQSQTLGIPDRFGIFSPQPPRLQVHQATAFIVFLFGACLTIVTCAFPLFIRRSRGLPNTKGIVAGQVVICVVLIAGLYWVMCCGRRRMEGYEWGDWKVHED